MFQAWLLLVCIATSADVRAENDKVVKVDGGWNLWSAWSDCSATCGSGSQTRWRYCADPTPSPGGQQCQGDATETRRCAEGHCPDCDSPAQCPDGGTLDDSCSLCRCHADDVITGKVRTDSFSPRVYLQGVLVYARGHEWQALATTDCHGGFSIRGICPEGLELMFVKKGYQAEHDRYRVGQTGATADVGEIRMYEAAEPTITQEPESVPVEEKFGVYLRCAASGYPNPTTFRWYKDGILVDYGQQTEETASDGSLSTGLHLTDLTLGHSGDYRCLAVSDAGSTWSQAASLLVYRGDAATPEEGAACTSDPKRRRVHLHQSCTAMVNGTPVTSIDVGACPRRACPYLPKSAAEPPIASGPTGPTVGICGPTDVNVVNVSCGEGFSYPLTQVNSCGCRWSMSDQNPGVLIEGRVQVAVFREGRLAGLENVPNMHFSVYGAEWTETVMTTDGGEFVFSLIPLKKTITLDFYAKYQTYEFYPQVSVVRLRDGVCHYRTIVYLRKKPPPIQMSVQDLESGQNFRLPRAGAHRSPGSVTYPKATLLDFRGYALPAESLVEVFLDFASTRHPEEFVTSPGEMLHEDSEAEPRYLKTHGQLWMQIEHRSEAVHTDCPSQITLRPVETQLPVPNSCTLDPGLWVLGKEAGQWKPWTSLKRIIQCDESWKMSSEKDRMRQLYGSPAKTASTSVWQLNHRAQAKSSKLLDRPVFNVAEDLPRAALCEIAVYVTGGSAREPLSGEQLTVRTLNKHGRLVSFISGFTGTAGKACLVVPCGHQHIISAWSLYGATASASHHLQPGFDFHNIDGGKSVRLTSPSADDVPNQQSSGPVYRYISHACASSATDAYHFSFHAEMAPVPDSLSAVDLGRGRLLSWYQRYSTYENKLLDEEPACFVRLALQTSRPQDIQIVATSRFGEDPEGDLFGTYTAGLHSLYDASSLDTSRQGDYFACIQVKCAGDLISENGQLYEDVKTRVDLKVLSPADKICKIRWIADYLVDENNSSEGNDKVLPLGIRSHTNSSLAIVLNPVSYWDGWDLDYRIPGFYKELGASGRSSSVGVTHAHCIRDRHNSVALVDCADGSFGTEWWEQRDEPGSYWELDVSAQSVD